MGDRSPFVGVHTGEAEARAGAICFDCGGFDCPGVYDGACGYSVGDAVSCPCGCGGKVSERRGVSYSYDRSGFNWGNERNERCKAASLPPDDANAALFRGQDTLERSGVGAYEYELVGSGDFVTGVLFCGGSEVGRTDEDDYGRVVAQLHGLMMYHAAG